MHTIRSKEFTLCLKSPITSHILQEYVMTVNCDVISYQLETLSSENKNDEINKKIDNLSKVLEKQLLVHEDLQKEFDTLKLRENERIKKINELMTENINKNDIIKEKYVKIEKLDSELLKNNELFNKQLERSKKMEEHIKLQDKKIENLTSNVNNLTKNISDLMISINSKTAASNNGDGSLNEQQPKKIVAAVEPNNEKIKAMASVVFGGGGSLMSLGYMIGVGAASLSPLGVFIVGGAVGAYGIKKITEL